jgi:precorrin isomerase
MTEPARIHKLLADSPVGEDIEAMSFSTIDREAAANAFTPDQWEIVRRMIHTTGDVSLGENVRFSDDAVDAGVEALCAGKPIYVDANMSRAGLSMARLRSAFETYSRDDIHCHVSDADVAKEAKTLKLPRSVAAVRKAAPLIKAGGIVVFGNAPTGLLEVNRMIIEEGVRPALVIGVPVGFVNVVESKVELMKLGVPYIVSEGRRGGSPIAVSILHALCTVAGKRKEKKMNVEHRTSNMEHRMKNKQQEAFDTVILLGHGSRVPGADGSMLRVAEVLRARGKYSRVVTCNMSRLGPHFEEVFEKCVREGSRDVLLLPYFLNQGLHMKLDIPEKMQAAVKDHPDVRLVFGKNLGFDELLVDLVEKRIGESSELDDVRQVALPDEETYPVPEGQCEFVPMLPEVAEKWKEAHGSEAEHHH